MANKKRWTESHVEHGIGTLTFRKWQYFVTYINAKMLDYNYIWRGHRRDDWVLESTLGRLLKKKSTLGSVNLVSAHQQLEQFKEASQGRRGRNPPIPADDNEWWALGQHHGLATPLLDWTASPFAAAFFAFESEESGTTYRAVYALHRHSVEAKAKAIQEDAISASRKIQAERAAKGEPPLNALAVGLASYTPALEVEFIKPRSDENQRLIVQNGVFSRMRDSKASMESWIRKNFPKEESRNYILMRYLIPNSDREEALRMLNRMNINHSTLFPDLQGTSWFCNMSRLIPRY